MPAPAMDRIRPSRCLLPLASESPTTFPNPLSHDDPNAPNHDDPNVVRPYPCGCAG